MSNHPTTTPKFKPGQRVLVSDYSIGIFGRPSRTEYSTRTVSAVRLRRDYLKPVYQYKLAGSGYWVDERRIEETR